MPTVLDTVAKGSQVYTDEYRIYNHLNRLGYEHDKILHSQKIYFEGDVHTNTIERFWSLVKNGIKGVFH